MTFSQDNLSEISKLKNVPTMKRIEIILLFLFLNALALYGQESTYLLIINTPDKIDDTELEWGQEEMGGIIRQETNYGQYAQLDISAWTWNNLKGINRGLIKFNLDQLPANALIVKAELSLYHYDMVSETQPMSSLSGSNEVYLKRVTSNWSEDTVTWNTQPETTDENQVILPMSTSRTQDYIDIDVTKLINEIIVSGENYGFMLQLATEEYYRSMIFCSSEIEDSILRPKLVIEYRIADNKEALISNARKISATQGDFTGHLDAGDRFGFVEAIGDIDGDGIEDMAVGAPWDDDGGTDYGAVWILFMNSDRTVRSQQKISATQGGFTGQMSSSDRFGLDIASLGDFDNDGVPDIAVGANADYDGGTNSGAVWLLFLKNDGTVKSYQKISASEGGMVGLTASRQFGYGITSLGDLDGDGITDIAVGSPTYDNDGGLYKGCVWILFLNSNGTVKSQQKIDDYYGGFSYSLDNEERFGISVSNIGDINKDGIVDIAVGSWYNDGDGAIYILNLGSDGTVKSSGRISALEGNFGGTILTEDHFGNSIANLGDIDGDGTNDLLTSSYLSDEGGTDRGKIWILHLKQDGTVKDYMEFSSTSTLLEGMLDDGDGFGESVSVFSGVNQDNKKEIIVGAKSDDDGNTNSGAVYILDMDIPYNELATNIHKISATEGGFTGHLDAGDQFVNVCPVGDINGDGYSDIVVGAPMDDDGGTDKGAVWILFLDSNRTVKDYQKISSTQGGFTGYLNDDKFGNWVTSIGDLDKDGVEDIAVGAYYDDDGGVNSGAVWILFLNNNGTFKSYQKISSTQGGLVGLTSNRFFGTSISNLGDLDGDGTIDIAVGAPMYDNDGGLYRGSVWILFLNPDGTVKSNKIISQTQGGFDHLLDDNDHFGRIVTNIGDINGDGIPDISASAENDDDGGYNTGALYILFLNRDGTVKGKQKISTLEGNFKGEIFSDDLFGFSSAGIGDFNGDGINDIAVGAPGSDETGTNQGKIYILCLDSTGKVKEYEEITANNPALAGRIEDNDEFGKIIRSRQGLTPSGKKELMVGAPGDDDGATDAGAVYFMDVDMKFKPVAKTGDDQIVCSNSSVHLDGKNSTVLDGDALQYFWRSLGSLPLDNNRKSELTIKAPEVYETTSYNFILTVTCQGIATNDTVTITVNPQPKTAIYQVKETLYSTVPNFESYQWYFDDEVIPNSNSSSYMPVNDGYYSLVVTNNYGCSSEMVNSKFILVTPLVEISETDTICSGSIINLNSDSTHMPDGTAKDFTYNWSCDKLTIANDTLPKITVVTPEVTTITQLDFILQVLRSDGLASGYDTLSVIVKPKPIKPFIKQFADTLLVTKVNSCNWYLGGLEIGNQHDSTLVIQKSGNYQVEVINDLGCVSDISDPVNFICSGIDELGYSVKVYPNPTTGIVDITGLPNDKNISVTLYDQGGKICLQTYSESGAGQLNLSGLTRGQYLIVIGNQYNRSIKILKQ
jgi:hypothetical protein